MTIKKDLLTGEEFRPKRRNQKFRTSANRTAYHNEQAYKNKLLRKVILFDLIQNHKILMTLIPEKGKRASFTREYLLGKGLNLMILTHYEKVDNKVCPALFNFVYLNLNEQHPSLTIYRKS